MLRVRGKGRDGTESLAEGGRGGGTGSPGEGQSAQKLEA